MNDRRDPAHEHFDHLVRIIEDGFRSRTGELADVKSSIALLGQKVTNVSEQVDKIDKEIDAMPVKVAILEDRSSRHERIIWGLVAGLIAALAAVAWALIQQFAHMKG